MMRAAETPVQPFALFEDNANATPSAILLSDLARRICCTHAAQVQSTLRQLDQARLGGAWVALAASYEMGYALEARLSQAQANHTEAPLIEAWVFNEATSLQGAALENWWHQQFAQLSPQMREAGILHWKPRLSRQDYLARAAQILQKIAAGECYQANLTFPIDGQIYGSPLALYHQLRSAQPVHHGVLLIDGERSILSRSPELFVSRQGQRLHCRPMKGTAPRHADAIADAAQAAALQRSAKNRAENLMIVDLIRNDLGRLAPAGGVQVDALFALESYPSVFQLTSSISAAPVEADFAQIMQALFPCGSVTGAPKIRAMEILRELEITPRGLYCGALGYLAPDGDFSLNVPIRTLQLQGQQLRMDVGSGIVADSEPEQEFSECLDKALFATLGTADLALIETLRYDAAQHGCALLEFHLQRLGRSAKALNIHYDRAALRRQIEHYCAPLGAEPQRVRALLKRDGSLSLAHAALDALPARLCACLSPNHLLAADSRLQHKTTARQFYDQALQEAMAAGYFDVIFLNQAGEFAEGARSSVFIKDGQGQLWTPPLQAGALPGVLRASLLAQGQVKERALRPDDLAQTGVQLYLGNALRGLLAIDALVWPSN